MRPARPLLSVVLLAAAVAVTGCAGHHEDQPRAVASGVHSSVPADIDPSARYLIYLHGRIIEDQGVRPTHPRFGTYEYEAILDAFAARGFIVISERRPAGTNGASYAAEVVDQVSLLLAAGVPQENIAVVGFSKGGGIAIHASSMLAAERVNFVFIGACGPWLDSQPELVPSGRMLSLHEESDDLAASCGELFARMVGGNETREIVLKLGGGHGAFYRPRPEWLDPVADWANP